MKKKLLLSITLLIALITFNSCKSNFSVLKRHYTHGFYFEGTKDHQHVTKFKKVNPELKTPQTTIPSVYQDAVKNAVIENKNMTIENKNMTIENNNSYVNTSLLPYKREQPLIADSKSTLRHLLHPTEFKIAAKKESEENKERHRSPLWILIVLLVVLWAISLFSGGLGLGLLINLFLFLALVLFILWLLRII